MPIALFLPAFLERVDLLIRQSAKAICSLPSSMPLILFDSGRKVHGVGMLRTSWEVSMQHLAIIYKISKVQDRHGA